jgi:multiple sugar transport system substrate-binding protein
MPSFPLPPSVEETPPQTTPITPEPVAPAAEAPSIPTFAPVEPAPTIGDSVPTESAPPPPLPDDPNQGQSPASLPEKKGNPFKMILFGMLALVFLAVIGFGAFQLLKPKESVSGEKADTGLTGATTTPKAGSNKEPVTITYWGIWESGTVMKTVIDEFEKQNPDIKVSYSMQSHKDYKDRIQTALQSTSVPDVVRLHASWLPILYPALQASPADGVTATEIQANFYPAALGAVTLSNQIYGAPSTMDGLSLFVNESIFQTAQLTVPKDWQEVRDVAKKLTQKDQNGNIVQSGVALGTTGNVDHWSDIVTLMLLQNGVDLKAPDTNLTSEALLYYTYFSTQDQVWNETLPSSVQAFAGGKVAMILAPSWRAIEIKAMNPTLAWKIYPVPQLPGAKSVSWVHFWVETVPKNAKHPKEAWRFVKYLASSQAQQTLFTAGTAERGYAQAPANKALAERLKDNPFVGPFVEQAQFGQTFYTASATQGGDTSINERLIKYLEDAVNTLRQSSGNPEQAVKTLQLGFNQVLSQYRLVAPLPTPTP